MHYGSHNVLHKNNANTSQICNVVTIMNDQSTLMEDKKGNIKGEEHSDRYLTAID
jgi:hypothetical protein